MGYEYECLKYYLTHDIEDLDITAPKDNVIAQWPASLLNNSDDTKPHIIDYVAARLSTLKNIHRPAFNDYDIPPAYLMSEILTRSYI